MLGYQLAKLVVFLWAAEGSRQWSERLQDTLPYSTW
jgi:hypothetical protein